MRKKRVGWRLTRSEGRGGRSFERIRMRRVGGVVFAGGGGAPPDAIGALGAAAEYLERGIP